MRLPLKARLSAKARGRPMISRIDLRAEGEDERVAHRLPEHGVGEEARVVLQPGEAVLGRAHAGVGQREVDRHEERVGDEERQVEERGGDPEEALHALSLEPAPADARRAGRRWGRGGGAGERAPVAHGVSPHPSPERGAWQADPLRRGSHLSALAVCATRGALRRDARRARDGRAIVTEPRTTPLAPSPRLQTYTPGAGGCQTMAVSRRRRRPASGAGARDPSCAARGAADRRARSCSRRPPGRIA